MKLDYSIYSMTLNDFEKKKAIELNQPFEYLIRRYSENLVKVFWDDQVVFYNFKHFKKLVKDGKWILDWRWMR